MHEKQVRLLKWNHMINYDENETENEIQIP